MADSDIFLQKRIFDWSLKLPDWQRGLMRLLCEGPLDEESCSKLLAVLCEDPEAPSLDPLELSHLPADETEHGVVELREIRNLRNINRLAEDQTLRFGPGLNIVFGENGAGKSGYGRLCRRVCRSAEPGEVLRDVFDPGKANSAQTAEFVLSVDGQDQTVEIDLDSEAPRILSAMTAFDASCAQFYISKSNTIKHTPRPLRLLEALSEAQDQVAQTLAVRIAERRDNLPALPTVGDDTNAVALLQRVERGEASESEVRSFAVLDEDETAELEALEKDEAAIIADQSVALERGARERASTIGRLITELEGAWRLLDDKPLAEIDKLRADLARASGAFAKAASDAFVDQQHPETGGDVWRAMWDAARQFVEAGGGVFPDDREGASCPLCQQDLEAAARDRLRRFEEFVTGNLRAQVRQLEADLSDRIGALPDVAQNQRSVAAMLAETPEQVQDAAKLAFEVLADRRALAQAEPNPPQARSLNLIPLRGYVDDKTSEAEKFANLRNEEERSRIKKRLTELRSRRTIAQSLDAVLAHIVGLAKIAAWEDSGKQLSTRAVSNQIGKLSKLAVTTRLHEALKEEIEGLDPIADRVELNDSASKGKPSVQFKLRSEGRERVAKVLSTGEQTALATAFFFADLQVSKERSAIILDDPISSLDHQRREHVAARLIEEAKGRQVVVLTHDLIFVYYLQEAAAAAEIELQGQALTRAFHKVGVIGSDLPWKVKSPADRLRALRHELKSVLTPLFKGEDPHYEREVHRWVMDLRKAYERLIEAYVLGGTVERHSRNIRVRQLHQVTWTADLASRIDAAVKELSGDAHQEPLERQSSPPTPDKLTTLLDKFQAICDETKPGKNREASNAEPVSAAGAA